MAGLLGRIVAALRAGFAPNRAFEKRVAATPRQRLGDLSEGVSARVTGTVRSAGELLTAPLSGRACVYYSVKVYSVTERRGGAWDDEVGAVHDGVSFSLVDGDAVALVDTAHAHFSVSFDHDEACAGTFDANPAQVALIQRCVPASHEWWNTQRLKFREACVREHQLVGVIGSALREAAPGEAPDGLFRGQAATRLRLRGTREHPLVVTDDPSVR